MPRLNALFYDCEIINCVPDKQPRDEKFTYCHGWKDFKGMGVACICAYDALTQMPHIYTKGNFGEFCKLAAEREEIVGYNSRHFDDKLCQAHQFNVITTYDIMEEIVAKMRLTNFRGLNLGAICAANNLPTKERGAGANAPRFWQLGQYGMVIDYCMHDVMLTYRLFLKWDKMRLPWSEQAHKLREPKIYTTLRQQQELEEGMIL